MPRRLSTTRKIIGIALSIGLPFACGVLYLSISARPPKEGKLIQNFELHRSAFESLKTMLLADSTVLSVGESGVETEKSIIRQLPPEGGFPVARYDQYLALLKETGGSSAFRARGEHSTGVGISIWASGFAG